MQVFIPFDFIQCQSGYNALLDSGVEKLKSENINQLDPSGVFSQRN